MSYIEIDANGLPIGRVASQVALILNGKMDTDFMTNKVTSKKVRVINVAKVILTGNKFNQKAYYSHSGYHGAIKMVPLKKIFEKDPCKLFEIVLGGMLSNNRLKDDKLNRVKLEA